MAQFKGYGDNVELESADSLVSHKMDDGRVFVIEYEVHGTILATGVKYDNRFCSIIEIENRKNCALEGLHGLSGSLECIDGADSIAESRPT